MLPFVRRIRSTVKHFLQHDDDFSKLEDLATANNLKFGAYEVETPTRWSGFLNALITVIKNNKALEMLVSRDGLGTKPKPLTKDELMTGIAVAAVLEPLRHATKIAEGDAEKGLASVALPLWASVVEALKAPVFSVPKPLQHLREQAFQSRHLPSLADKLRHFLVIDLNKVKGKHLDGTSGHRLLEVASFLDIRFKSHELAFKKSKVDEVKAEVCRLAVLSHEDAERMLEYEQKKRDHPFNAPLASLVKPTAKNKAKARPKPAPASQPSDLLREAAAPWISKKRRRLVPCTSEEDFLFRKPSRDEPEEPAMEQAARALEEEVKSQMTRYEAVLASPSLHVSSLQWWSEHCSTFPNLAVVARNVLGIPTSTASLERLFSGAGRGITKRRPRLKTKRSADLIFGHANVMLGCGVA